MNNANNTDPARTSPAATLFVVSAVQFLAPFMMSAVGVALPTIGRFYGASAFSLGLVEMVYILAVTLFLLPMGRLADIVGRKKIFIAGVALFTIATAMLPFAPTIETFIAFRFLQGIGSSCNISTSIAILSAVFPQKTRGRAMGVIVACVYLGLSAGPTLAGLMITYLGWQWIFFVAVPIALCALSLAAIRLKGEWKGAEGKAFDGIGSVIYMISLFCLIVGISHLKEGTWALVSMATGMAGLIGFAVFEFNHRSPILDMRLLLGNRTLAFSNIATWINYAASFGLTFFFSLYLQVVKGLSPQATGLLLIVQPLIQAVLSPVAGILADRRSPSKMATLGMATCALGLGIAAFIGQDSQVPHVILVMVVMGIGFAAFASPNMATIMGSVEPRHYGIASSLVATMRSVGMLTAMTIITVLLGMFMGDAEVSAATIPGFLQTMHTGFVAFAVMNLVGIGFSMARVS
ncbi:MFS transporter [uncultured Desulfosarcina sp.]|uniref:MFS transporter n=1 Tax=uncultured Desulfosarcina sp. TaxID=218289 RepID=UPI0029C7E254|nr:MFS transporter [uncultured Desulfosarcina sp.]